MNKVLKNIFFNVIIALFWLLSFNATLNTKIHFQIAKVKRFISFDRGF